MYNANGIHWAYVHKYTMVLKIKGCMFLDTLGFICLPTNILVLAIQGGCNGVTNIAVKLKTYNNCNTKVVTNIGCTVLGHIHCVRKVGVASLGVVVGGISLEPIVVSP